MQLTCANDVVYIELLSSVSAGNALPWDTNYKRYAKCVRGCIRVWVFMHAYTCCPSSTVCFLLFLCDHSWDVCDIRHSCGARYPIRRSPQDGTRHCRQPHSTDLSKVNCWYSHSTFVGVECRDDILFVCSVEPLFRGHHWDPAGCPV